MKENKNRLMGETKIDGHERLVNFLIEQGYSDIMTDSSVCAGDWFIFKKINTHLKCLDNDSAPQIIATYYDKKANCNPHLTLEILGCQIAGNGKADYKFSASIDEDGSGSNTMEKLTHLEKTLVNSWLSTTGT